MTPLAPREPALLYGLLMDRITQLLRARQLYRRMLRAEWTTNRWECETEVRALVRLARSARRQAEEAAAQDAVWRTTMLTRPEQEWDVKSPRELCLHGVRETEECPECGFGWTPEQEDPITAAKGYHDWQAAPDIDKVWTEAEMAYAAGR